MARRPKLTAKRARELLACNPETGELWWKERPGKPDFNAQWAGKPVGAVDPSTGYLRLMIDGRHQYVHRIVWLHTKGWLSGDLDHIDGDKTNCTLSNLRPATKAQNNANRKSPPRKTPGPRGSWFNKKTGKYQVLVERGHNGKRQWVYLGSYSDPAVAARAYQAGIEDLHGEFAYTARPEPKRGASA